jgi:hypothetical protein
MKGIYDIARKKRLPFKFLPGQHISRRTILRDYVQASYLQIFNILHFLVR